MCVTRRSVTLVQNVGYNNLIILHASEARTVTCELNDLFDCYITCHSCSGGWNKNLISTIQVRELRQQVV